MQRTKEEIEKRLIGRSEPVLNKEEQEYLEFARDVNCQRCGKVWRMIATGPLEQCSNCRKGA